MAEARTVGAARAKLSRPAVRLRLAACTALCLSLAGACASAAAQSSATGRRCPPGAHDYGDGMVACLLSAPAVQALREAHERALAEAGPKRSSFLADQPWRPHVSVIYGVTDDRATPAQRALQAFVAQASGSTACFGQLQYWDDARGDKTTLVVDVDEPTGVLTALHDRLAEAARIGSRFAYHPHVTLAYLALGTRLDGTQEARVLHPLQGTCFAGGAFYLTDPCGIERYRAEVAPTAP